MNWKQGSSHPMYTCKNAFTFSLWTPSNTSFRINIRIKEFSVSWGRNKIWLFCNRYVCYLKLQKMKAYFCFLISVKLKSLRQYKGKQCQKSNFLSVLMERQNILIIFDNGVIQFKKGSWFIYFLLKHLSVNFCFPKSRGKMI